MKSAAAGIEATPLREALDALDQGARALETAYRELWTAREHERRGRDLAFAERMRDLGHELKNPLGGVRGLAILLERDLAETLASEKSRRLARRIREGLLHVESVLQGRLAAPEGSSDPRAVALEIADLARAERYADGHDVVVEVEAPEGIELPIPAARLAEILGNLVRNAAEATEAATSAGRVLIRVASNADEVIVEVADDGCGLPDVPAAAIGQRGFSTKGEGRGRGLAIVRELLDACAGTLTFQRTSPGTRAVVRIPRRAA